MEHSKTLGSKEEYGSSVSGWTMYIGSPVHEKYNYDDDDHHSNDEQGDECNKYYYGYDHDDDDDDDANGKSDDSMASDASSRPSHRELTWESSAQSLDRHGASTYSSKEKLHKQRMKRDERRIKVETDKPVLKAKGAANPAQTGGKVRKSIYAGRGK
ncbi:hypothetical protein Dsin_009753 [Dipteronia sinensis]|uniref:Uncharacterized protein n=1 Tax=Dipteronia sinensis TaxID=43782 RepID=A0AAE0EBX4_9ROSI|nr:hypothetical protein Dsin_009753 [Dipteronia sinensis]